MKKTDANRPRLEPGITLGEFNDWYWLMAELKVFAQRLGLRAGGPKPALTARIKQQLRGLPAATEPKRAGGKAAKDSLKPLRAETPVVSYRSDDATRAFFTARIGARFHFTWHLNQFRLAHPGLTYGDLVAEWLAEEARRKAGGYEAVIAPQGEYNQHIRAFFADPENRGKTFRDAVRAWNRIKQERRPTSRRA